MVNFFICLSDVFGSKSEQEQTNSDLAKNVPTLSVLEQPVLRIRISMIHTRIQDIKKFFTGLDPGKNDTDPADPDSQHWDQQHMVPVYCKDGCSLVCGVVRGRVAPAWAGFTWTTPVLWSPGASRPIPPPPHTPSGPRYLEEIPPWLPRCLTT